MPEPEAPRDATLEGVLRDAARTGLLGPGELSGSVEHSRGFLTVLRPAGKVLDLGSGAGLPGLVVAVERPELDVVLLDASERRTDALRRSVGRLGLGGRVRVIWRRAEDLGRDPAWRGCCDAVVARSFGPPGLVAECAAPLLRAGGQLVVSEPPSHDPGRWPADGLAEFGLVRDAVATQAYASFTLVGSCPDRYPRRSPRQLRF